MSKKVYAYLSGVWALALMFVCTDMVVFWATGVSSASGSGYLSSGSWSYKTILDVVRVTSGTADLEWEKVDGFKGYVVHYDTKPFAESKKYAYYSNVVESTGTTLKNLTPNITYYGVLTAFDQDANEIPLSQEIKFTTSGWDIRTTADSQASKNDSIQRVNIVTDTKIEVFISHMADYKDIVKTDIHLATKADHASVKIKSVSQSDNKMVVTLETPLETSQEYVLTIASLTEKSGNAISDLRYSFSAPVSLFAAGKDDTNNVSAPTTEDSLKSDGNENIEGDRNKSSTGANIGLKPLQKLPQTGPVASILIVLSFVIALCASFVLRARLNLKK